MCLLTCLDNRIRSLRCLWIYGFCIPGNRFALMETKSLLAHLLSRFSIKVVSKTPIPIKIIQKGFNVTAEGGFWLGLEKRTSWTVYYIMLLYRKCVLRTYNIYSNICIIIIIIVWTYILYVTLKDWPIQWKTEVKFRNIWAVLREKKNKKGKN